MKFSLLLLLTIVSAVLSTSQGPDTRIVGGYPATIYNYPFVVSIVYTNPETGEQTPRCVGSIISSWHVLTTAHCFSDPNVENYKLRVGSTSSMEGGTLFDIYYIIIHPDYVESPRTADAAIVVLTQHVTISESVRVIYIPPQETYIPDGYTVRAIGWGAEEEDGALLDTLKVFDTRTIPLQQCIEAFADDDNINVYDPSAAAPGSRLTGGSPLPVEEFPSVVAITYYYPRPQITVQRCVGSLVSSIHVMTAASCFDGADLENMRVRAGSAQPLSGGTDVGVTHFIAHPDFEESPRTADIAVLFLEQFLPITSTVNILYLPPPGYDIPDGISLRVASWGFESLDGGPLNDLKSALLPKIPLAQCQQAFADSEEASITPSVVCTFAPGQGICHGDVGAPAVISNVLVGIASYYENCDGTHPDVWTRVDSYTTWIMQVTAGASRMLTV